MQITCPNCATPIPAEHINIQKMVAVCPTCHTVFEFEPPQSKIKRRKAKQPDQLTMREGDNELEMAFRTNFRLDRNETFLISGGLSIFFTFLTAIIVNESLTDGMVFLVPLGFMIFTALLYYWFALTAYNKTHIELDDSSITVSRKPIPGLSNRLASVNLSGINAIHYEETPKSKKEGYDTPRFNVRARMDDGSTRIIVADLIEEYAVFICQRLEEYILTDAQHDVSRLVEGTQDAEPTLIQEEAITRSDSDLP